MKTKLVPFALAIAASMTHDDARACSCVGPRLALLSPIDADAAPTNVHVRLEAPSQGLRLQSFVLRAHGGAVVPTQLRSYPESGITIVELAPSTTLAPLTRFEVATIDPAAHPPTTVIGTFKTGSTNDTTAPRFDAIGTQRTRLNARYGHGDCSIQGPWIDLDDIIAQDDRADGKLVYGVWATDAAGRLDTQRQPETLVFPHGRGNDVSIGRTSLCDPRQFVFRGTIVNLAVAAIDESGNVSRPIRIRADLTRNTP